MKYTCLLGGALILKSSLAFALELPLKSPEDHCVLAQSLIGSYDTEKIAAISDFDFYKDLNEFVQSKPKIKQDRILLTGYTPNANQARSEYEQVWCKLKSADDLSQSTSLSLPIGGVKNNCDKINAAFLDTLFNQSPEIKTALSESGYSIVFKNKSYYTGGQWAPSYPIIELLENNIIQITTTSLESFSGIPVIGGMNYCKMVSSDGLKGLIQDLNQKPLAQLDRISLKESALKDQISGDNVFYQSVTIAEKSRLLTRRADLYWPLSPADGIFVLSPGGSVKPLQMRSLAKSLVQGGYGVFVVEYPVDLAIFERLAGLENTAYLYGSILKSRKFELLEGLDPRIKEELSERNLPIRLFGHSLGGAVLGDAIFGDQKIFDKIFLYGTMAFVQTKKTKNISAKNVQILFGANDGLSFRQKDSLDKFASDYHFEEMIPGEEYHIKDTPHVLRVLPNLNHFCIANDMTAGLDFLRSQDGDGPPPSECIPVLSQRLLN